MGKPTPEQIEQILMSAEKMRDDEDGSGPGHYLLYLHERNKHLEDVYTHVYHYLHSGQAAREHSMLLKAIEKAERAAHPHEDGPSVFGD